MLKTQELENIRQANIIQKLETALTTSDRKCKTEVQENGKIYYYNIFSMITWRYLIKLHLMVFYV